MIKGTGRNSRCCWCGGRFVRIDNHFWCESPACRRRQAAHAIAAEDGNGKNHFLYVPLPRQVMFDECYKRFMLGGGAAGSTKSHAARWSMYRRALTIPDYEGLLLRRTWPELEKHHFRLMEREERLFRNYGLNVTFTKTAREFKFHDTGAVIEGGHMENPDDVDKYLSRERDDIICDEGSTFEPRPLLELSTRARSTKPAVAKAGGARFRVYTNPGGAASATLRDFFIDHTPDWEQFPDELRRDYNPDEWVYIPGALEDNPYLPEGYERDLAVLTPWRFQQLRHNDWNIVAGLFFTEFAASTHVQDLGDPADSVAWFRSMDWGYVAPGVCHWWACLPDRRYYVRYEFKFSHATIPQVCSEIINRTKDAGISRVRYTAADPAMWQQLGTTGEAMNETFAKCRVPITKAHNDRVNGWQRCHEILALRSDGKPTTVIHPSCVYLIRTLASAISAKQNPEDIDIDDDHPLDSFRYGAMSRPAPTAVKHRTSNRTFKAAQQRIAEFRRHMSLR